MAVTVQHWSNGQAVTEVSGVGTTVEQGSSYLGDGDSNYWATAFVGGKWVNVYTGYTPAGIVIDATPEVREMWEAYVEVNRAHTMARLAVERAEREALEAQWEAAEPKRGRWVQVTSGRKVPKGTVGEVFWYGEGQWGWRVGFKAPGSDEAIWTAASNVTVIEAPGLAA